MCSCRVRFLDTALPTTDVAVSLTAIVNGRVCYVSYVQVHTHTRVTRELEIKNKNENTWSEMRTIRFGSRRRNGDDTEAAVVDVGLFSLRLALVPKR